MNNCDKQSLSMQILDSIDEEYLNNPVKYSGDVFYRGYSHEPEHASISYELIIRNFHAKISTDNKLTISINGLVINQYYEEKKYFEKFADKIKDYATCCEIMHKYGNGDMKVNYSKYLNFLSTSSRNELECMLLRKTLNLPVQETKIEKLVRERRQVIRNIELFEKEQKALERQEYINNLTIIGKISYKFRKWLHRKN